MKQIVFLSVFLLGYLVSFSQTKRIAHRSHSGKNNTLVYSHTGNFGLPEDDKKRKKFVRDSIQSQKTKKDSMRHNIDRRKSPLKDSVPAKTPVVVKPSINMIRSEVAVVVSAARYIVHLGS